MPKVPFTCRSEDRRRGALWWAIVATAARSRSRHSAAGAVFRSGDCVEVSGRAYTLLALPRSSRNKHLMPFDKSFWPQICTGVKVIVSRGP